MEKIQKLKKSALKVAFLAAKEEVKRNDWKWGRWPPACIGIYHQPKRPVK